MSDEAARQGAGLPLETRLVLLVDAEEVYRRRLSRGLERRGWEVEQAGNQAEALALIWVRRPALAVLEERIPGPSGLQVLRALLEHVPDMRAMILTGYGSIDSAVEAIHLGAIAYASKPADADEVLATFERAKRPPLAGTPGDASPTAPSLARAEWEHINRVLGDCAGNISEAARRLGIHRRTLQRKLHKHPPRS